ncbi:unnamed protein product [Moneuplotes crassus]|uniref:Uncharacterized protein n=1 Tax=Euplotes crassus TaxID=5936 RepID=A0AAD1UCU8_EUPCR|nr:unnamed protein product [Moneuplotes crassus]
MSTSQTPNGKNKALSANIVTQVVIRNVENKPLVTKKSYEVFWQNLERGISQSSEESNLIAQLAKKINETKKLREKNKRDKQRRDDQVKYFAKLRRKRQDLKQSSYDVLSRFDQIKKKNFQISCYKAARYSEFISNRLGLKKKPTISPQVMREINKSANYVKSRNKTPTFGMKENSMQQSIDPFCTVKSRYSEAINIYNMKNKTPRGHNSVNTELKNLIMRSTLYSSLDSNRQAKPDHGENIQQSSSTQGLMSKSVSDKLFPVQNIKKLNIALDKILTSPNKIDVTQYPLWQKMKKAESKISAARTKLRTGIDVKDEAAVKERFLIQKAATICEDQPQNSSKVGLPNIEERLKKSKSNWNDIEIYSNFVNRLLNQTNDKNLRRLYLKSKGYMMNKAKNKHKSGLDFYKRMEKDIKAWSNK